MHLIVRKFCLFNRWLLINKQNTICRTVFFCLDKIFDTILSALKRLNWCLTDMYMYNQKIFWFNYQKIIKNSFFLKTFISFFFIVNFGIVLLFCNRNNIIFQIISKEIVVEYNIHFIQRFGVCLNFFAELTQFQQSQERSKFKTEVILLNTLGQR